MDVKSEQKFDLVEVTDIDVAYPGATESYVLKKDFDKYAISTDRLVITFGGGGTISFNLANAHWMAIRPRTIRVPVPEPVTPKE